MTIMRLLFKIYRFTGIPLRLLLVFLIAFSSFPLNIQGVSADAGSTSVCEDDVSLVGCWRMEENGGTALIDGSSFSNDATLVGTPTWVTGKIGDYALNLDGTTQYATVADDASLDLISAISVAAWVRPVFVGYRFQHVISKESGFDFGLNSSDQVFIRLNNTTLVSTNTYAHDGSIWTHVAATWDGITIKLYINGVQETTTSLFSGPIVSNSNPIIIGSHNTDIRMFRGALDDMRLYNRSLDTAEILALASIPPTTYTISGNAGGVNSAILSYTDGTPKIATADGSGNYSLTVSTGWTGSVTPSKYGFVFDPISKPYTNVRADQTSQDYSAGAVYTISGNAGTGSAILYYTDTTLKTVTADGAGNYTFIVPSGWSGTVVPAMFGYAFDPVSKSYNNVLVDMPAENYTAAIVAPIYYVDKTNPSCTDTGPGTSPALPFCTIAKGASVVAAGGTVQVLAGSYAETVTVPNSGSAGLPITFSAVAGVVVTGNGNASVGGAFRISSESYIVVDGFAVTGTADHGMSVLTSDHITISNNHVSYSGSPASGSTRWGIYLNGTTASTVSGNTLDHNRGDGIRLAGGSANNLVSNNISFANAEQWQRNATGIQVTGTGSANNTLIHNITYANEDTGLQLYGNASDNILVGNLSYGNGDHGIDNLNSPNNIVVGNTVQGNHTAGINFEGTNNTISSSGAMIMNNISVDNGIAPITGQTSNIRVDDSAVPGTTMDYNLVYLSGAGTSMIRWNEVNYPTLADFQAAGTGQEVHGIQADPLFVSPVAYATRPPNVVVGDYQIKAGSPVIDSANADAPSHPSLDIEGNARVDDPSVVDTGAGTPSFADRGAYEYLAGFYTLTVNIVGIGTVALDPPGGVYVPGTEVSLTPIPNPDYLFDSWSGVDSGGIADAGGGVYTIVMDAAKSITATFIQTGHSISLYTGWNLISFNLNPTSTAIADVLSSISGNYDLVYAWDASDALDPWKLFNPSNPPFANDLTDMTPGRGYWIHMTAPATLTVVGTQPVSTEIPLSLAAGGWNLVGFPAAESLDLPTALSDHGVGTDFTQVYAYHVNDVGDPWKLFNISNPPFANDLSAMAPGWGYWIFVTAESTWTIPY